MIGITKLSSQLRIGPCSEGLSAALAHKLGLGLELQKQGTFNLMQVNLTQGDAQDDPTQGILNEIGWISSDGTMQGNLAPGSIIKLELELAKEVLHFRDFNLKDFNLTGLQSLHLTELQSYHLTDLRVLAVVLYTNGTPWRATPLRSVLPSDTVCQTCRSLSMNSSQYLVSACTWRSDATVADCSGLLCPHGHYRLHCGWGQKGLCVPCEACPDGEYRVGCERQDVGVCQPCPDGSYSIGYDLTCTTCRPPCSTLDSFEYESVPCKATGDRVCSSCTSLPDCGEGYYRQGCAGESAGVCSLCQPCPLGHERQGCSGLSSGACIPCPSGSFNSEALHEQRLPATFLQWRVRAANTRSGAGWQIFGLDFLDGSGSSLVSSEGGQPIFSSLLNDTTAEFALVDKNFQSGVTRVGRTQEGASSGGFFLGWAFDEPTAVAVVRLSQQHSLDATAADGLDRADTVIVEGRNLADFTQRLDGLCADRAGHASQDLVSARILLGVFEESGNASFQAACLQLCATHSAAAAATACELADGTGSPECSGLACCYVHTSAAVSRSQGQSEGGAPCPKTSSSTAPATSSSSTTTGLPTTSSASSSTTTPTPTTSSTTSAAPSTSSSTTPAPTTSSSSSMTSSSSSTPATTTTTAPPPDTPPPACTDLKAVDAGSEGGANSCWLATPAKWRHIFESEHSASSDVLVLNISRHIQQKGCQRCAQCDGLHEYTAENCSSVSDALCGSCSALTCSSSGLAITAEGDEWREACGLGSPGTCKKCDTCPAAQIRWNCWDEEPGICQTCDKEFFSEGDSPTCDPCTVCTGSQYIIENCNGTSNRVCKECSVRETEENCAEGFHFKGCGGGGRKKGYCARCAPCWPGNFKAASSDHACGNCVQCEAGKYTVAPGETSCSDCDTCSPGQKEVLPCTATQNRACVDVVCTVCGEGNYTKGCNVSELHPGSCVPCEPCVPGQMRVPGCGGTEPGTCAPCANGTFSPDGEGSCRVCNTSLECPEGSFESHCTATVDSNCSSCSAQALLCDLTQYLKGCGGNSPGHCEACASLPACPAGSHRAGCGGAHEGDCVACPEGTYVFEGTSCLECSSTCGAGMHKVDDCSDTSDITCVDCDSVAEVLCGAGTYLASCGEGSYECKSCSLCYEGFYIEAACSALSNTVCQQCAPCNTSETPDYILVSPCPGNSSDPYHRVCRPPPTTSANIPTTTTTTAPRPVTPSTTPVLKVVRVSLVMPMSLDEFDDNAQMLMVQAIAQAAGVEPSQVRIAGITAQELRRGGAPGRLLLAQGVKVDLEIATAGQAEPPSIDAINAQLDSVGLPQASLFDAAALPTTSAPPTTTTPSPTDGWPLWAVIAAAIGGGLVVLMALACLLLLRARQHAQEVEIAAAAAAAEFAKQEEEQGKVSISDKPTVGIFSPLPHLEKGLAGQPHLRSSADDETSGHQAPPSVDKQPVLIGEEQEEEQQEEDVEDRQRDSICVCLKRVGNVNHAKGCLGGCAARTCVLLRTMPPNGLR